MATTLLQVRVDSELKNQAASIYDALGIDISTAIRIFLKRSVMDNGVPFSMTLSKGNSKAEMAAEALKKLGEESIKNGTSNMTLEEINDEIDEARK